jgi:two-component system, chemotaxis family, protein-glutamate methylesterase/glutaminase
MDYQAIVMGTSAGGLSALSAIFESLPVDYPIPIVVVQHRSTDERTLLEEILSHKCKISIKQADEKENIEPGKVYFAPAGYHLLIEKTKTFSLSSDRQVNYSRPSIDVLFETAAAVYKDKLLAIILTGANQDGAAGMRMIKEFGGVTIAQDPVTAQYPVMPKAAIDTGCIGQILGLNEIKNLLMKIGKL